MTIVEYRCDLPQALVVGAGGMGAAIARRLGEHYTVALADLDIGRAEAVAATLSAEGITAFALACDICDDASVAAMFERIDAPIAVLVHVAALSPSMAGWRDIVRVNLVGAARIASAAASRMADGGAAVLISSVGGHMFVPSSDELKALDEPMSASLIDDLARAGQGEPDPVRAYMLAKRGMMRLCERLARSWGARNVRINSLSPGLIKTPMGDREFAQTPMKAGLVGKLPIARLGSLVEIADAVEFLCSRKATYITGTDLLVDGGLRSTLGIEA